MDMDNMLEIEDDVLGQVEPEKEKDKKDNEKDKSDAEEEMDTMDQSKMDWNKEIDEKEEADKQTEKDKTKTVTQKSDNKDKTKDIKKRMDKMKEKNKEVLGGIASMRLKEAWQLDSTTYQGKDQARKRLASLKTFLDREVKVY